MMRTVALGVIALVGTVVSASAQDAIVVAPAPTDEVVVLGRIPEIDRPHFREYVVRENVPSYRWGGDVSVGSILPEIGIQYYDMPSEYHLPQYRYTIVNDEPVIVEPRTRRVVEVIE